MTFLAIAALLLTDLLSGMRAPWCGPAKITGYLRTAGGTHTYDGTPIWTDENIAAASWDVRLGAIAEISGVGVYRIADRGMLGNGDPMPWVDVAVWSYREALDLTSVRRTCFRRPLM